ncbi:hypothetical protein [Pectobacterium phage Wc4-1]|uniref:Uncharacterized protein n=2 Tax=Arnovirus TaxID=3425109 RepID=A0A5P8D4A4_9CAUD|nr:hypothetical protein Arno162_135 [Pectobacterium phage Arno162]QFP93814.1 hypothetical protein [Pectobacterium phage Wc4]QFP93959.1 hypothetical protein [Pectobacterium phage Wc4-1]
MDCLDNCWTKLSEQEPEENQHCLLMDADDQYQYGVAACVWSHGSFSAITSMLSAENFDGGAHITVNYSPSDVYWQPINYGGRK